MKLSKVISELQEVLQKEGDLDCYFASDDEGNSYQKQWCTGTVMGIRKQDKDNYRPELYSIEELEDYDLEYDDIIKIVVTN